MKHKKFGVVVVGGGHAGCEAAHASARMGVDTVLVTLNAQGIGVMSCNPAIGGLGKGHLVREIDALDGLMARVADASGIQFRLLNRRKGPAVHGPRTQSDRDLYRFAMLQEISKAKNLRVIEGEVVDFNLSGDAISGVVLADGSLLECEAVILTTGTFLNGLVHIGDQKTPSGRMGEKSVTRLAERLKDLDLPLGRLKTGTPPRLDTRSIAWDGLDMQPGDDDPEFFSFLTNATEVQQIACGITHTNEQTHEIIRKNLEKSAMYGGHIDGIGPRYCPSIEDKIVRFSDKTSHQIFLEPEGLTSNAVYPNGISTSLPQEVQLEYVHSIKGLENAEVLQMGYAIEYDYVDPRALTPDLALRNLPSLFLAGQINGTTGYEEAAAQGLVAGLNAASRVMRKDSIRFSRADSYIGVMVDDLTSRGVSEPYRMFTSRAEFRLSLRIDNADQRLTPLGVDIGCVSAERQQSFQSKMESIRDCREALRGKTWSATELNRFGVPVKLDGQRRTLEEVLSLPDVQFQDIVLLDPELASVSEKTGRQLEKEAMYMHYIERQSRDIDALRKDENLQIPEDFDYSALGGLSNELKAKFLAHRPSNLAQAGRIDGVTPAALSLILINVRKKTAKSA